MTLCPQNLIRDVQTPRGTPHGANPATLALTSLLLQFSCCIRGNPVKREVTVRGSIHDAPSGCTALTPPPCLPGFPLQVPLLRSCSNPLLHPWVAPVWQQHHSPRTSCGLWCQLGPTRCVSLAQPRTCPVPKECPQKRMLLFPLCTLAQSQSARTSVMKPLSLGCLLEPP